MKELRKNMQVHNKFNKFGKFHHPSSYAFWVMCDTHKKNPMDRQMDGWMDKGKSISPASESGGIKKYIYECCCMKTNAGPLAGSFENNGGFLRLFLVK